MCRSSFILSEPEAIRRVLVENQANYARTVGTTRILRRSSATAF